MNNTQSSLSTTLDELLLLHDKRGISALRYFLPADNYLQTAEFALQRTPRVLIVTGFYVVNDSAETDGPLGAMALANGFLKLGSQVTLVTDRYCLPLLESARPNCKLIEFPITDSEESRLIAQKILTEIQPTLLISIEHCSQTPDGTYRNMHSRDVSQYTPQVDYLFIGQENTIGIGDGGNEIGMGLIREHLLKTPELVAIPASTVTTRLLISTVSNWAAYGLLGAMSIISGKALLPSVEEQSEMLHDIVARGAVDGVLVKQVNSVDGFDETINNAVLQDIHKLIDQQMATANKK